MASASATYSAILYKRLFAPRSHNIDDKRREFIANVLISGLAISSLIALFFSAVNLLGGNFINGLSSLFVTLVFTLVVLSLWRLSRRGHYKVVSYFLLLFVGLIALQLILEWSFELPMADLAFGLMIVMAGVLISARGALIFSIIASAAFLIIGLGQIHQVLHPRTSWLDQNIQPIDVIGYVIIFAIIALVSWLANREIDRSLKRARASEAALAAERDTLEVKVVERTRALEQVQREHALELQRFAEFGRISAGLLHDVTNPLTAVSLNLEQYNQTQETELVDQARYNLHQLERYIDAARNQLKDEGSLKTFSVNDELRQTFSILGHMAHKRQIKLVLDQTENYELYGDAVKFSQLMTNLVANAVEAYPIEAHPKNLRSVDVTVSQDKKFIVITVKDSGQGISKAQLAKVFEPFYSTKSRQGRGLGMGLAIVKQYVEADFGGKISVTSSPKIGTEFTVRLQNAKKK